MMTGVAKHGTRSGRGGLGMKMTEQKDGTSLNGNGEVSRNGSELHGVQRWSWDKG